MLQRIQTLYLFLIVVLGTLLCFYSPMQFLLPQGSTYIDMMACDKWPLMVLCAAIPLLALVNIFLFKHRMVQARLNVVNAILCLGYYAMLALYVAFVLKGYELVDGVTLAGADWYPTMWAAIPLVNIVLLVMATRRILKDEALVRAADRLR